MTGPGKGGPGPPDPSVLPPNVLRLLARAQELRTAPPHPRVSPLAVELCRRALAQVPDDPEVSLALARTLHAHARGDEAAAVCDAALAAHPDAVEVELERLLLAIPVVYGSPAEPAQSRAEYAARLEELERRMELAPAEEYARLGLRARRLTPYLLPYQGLDDAPLQRRLGALLHRAVAAAHPLPPAPPPVPDLARRPLRVGFVSSQFCSHTVWHVVTRGWLAGLRARGFACYGYAVGGPEDDCTEASRRDCVRFLSGRRSFAEWAAAIREDRLDALIHPAIGYSRVADALALVRLAPVQCTTFGHCETSGFPTVDCFLSGALVEPEDGDAHYTEQLVRLPDVGLSYPGPRVTPSPRGRAHPGLRDDTVLFLSPHLAKKYLPRDDELYARIAECVPGAQLVFFRDSRVEAVTRILEQRLRAAFGARGVDPAGRLVFLDRMERDDYESLLMAADVYLDVPGWNGGTTTAEALVRHVPTVTLEGGVARGRMGAGMLRHAGLDDYVARSADEYVEIASRLGRDEVLREAVRGRLAVTAGRISDDAARVDALTAFLESAVPGSASRPA